MHLADAFAGAMVRCPSCGTVQRVGPARAVQGRGGSGDEADSLDDLGLIEATEQREQERIREAAPPSPAEPPESGTAVSAEAPADLSAIEETEAAVQELTAPPRPAQETAAPTGRSTMFILLSLGLVGVVAGFLIVGFSSMGIVAAYIGAAIGWLVGFGYGLMIVFGMGPEDEQSAFHRPAPSIVVCRKCGQTIPLGTVRCPRCGSTAAVRTPTTLLTGALQAAHYARSNLQSLVGMMMLFVGGFVALCGLTELLPRRFAFSELQLLGLETAAAFVQVFVWAYLVRYGLHVAARSIVGLDHLPDLPGTGPVRIAVTCMRVLGVCVFYVLPVVTLPLLPLGLLALAYANDARAYNLLWAGRWAIRRPRELAILWLVVLIWGAALALAVAVIVTLTYKAVAIAPAQRAWGAVMLSVGIRAIGWAAIGVAATVFSIAVFRCVGLFGRFNREVLSTLPPMTWTVRTAIGMLLIGVTAAGFYLWVLPHLPVIS